MSSPVQQSEATADRLAEELRLCIDALRNCHSGVTSVLATGDGAGHHPSGVVPELAPDLSIPELLAEAAHARRSAQQALDGFLRTSRRHGIESDGASPGRPASDHRALSKREREVLGLIVAGKTSKQIAAHLGISFKTAVTHRTSIMDKLQVHEIASLVREAIRQQLV